MLYSICDLTEHFDQLVGRKVAKADGSYDIRNRKLGKIGRRPNYPGGQAFLTVEDATRALQMIQCYEFPAKVSDARSAELQSWVVGITDVPTYEFREGLRTLHDARICTIYPLNVPRFRFRTGAMTWDAVPDFMRDLQLAFPDEASLALILPDIITKAQTQFTKAETRFMVEGPSTKQLMLAKLRFAA